MLNNLFENYGLYIYIGLGILLLIIIILIIKNIILKKPEEKKSSILDVSIDGVVDKDFEYGFEKEDTIVMKPVEKETKKKNTKKKK